MNTATPDAIPPPLSRGGGANDTASSPSSEKILPNSLTVKKAHPPEERTGLENHPWIPGEPNMRGLENVLARRHSARRGIYRQRFCAFFDALNTG